MPLKKLYPRYFYRLAKPLEIRMWDRWSYGELFLLTNAFCCFTDIWSLDDFSFIHNAWQMKDSQLSIQKIKNLNISMTQSHINFIDLSQIKVFLNSKSFSGKFWVILKSEIDFSESKICLNSYFNLLSYLLISYSIMLLIQSFIQLFI